MLKIVWSGLATACVHCGTVNTFKECKATTKSIVLASSVRQMLGAQYVLRYGPRGAVLRPIVKLVEFSERPGAGRMGQCWHEECGGAQAQTMPHSSAAIAGVGRAQYLVVRHGIATPPLTAQTPENLRVGRGGQRTRKQASKRKGHKRLAVSHYLQWYAA